jgi:hypothetical protein
MSRSTTLAVSLLPVLLLVLSFSRGVEGRRPAATAPPDAVAQAQAPPARPSSPAFEDQPDKGQANGVDFYRDPLNAKPTM